MTRKFNLLCAAALMSALCATTDNLIAQSTWDYPVKPGTPEWAAFTTHDQMVEAIQIPEEVLNSLTTAELVELCLNYPLSFDFFAYNSLQDGLRKNVAVNFNGVQELLHRRDNAQYLLDVLNRDDLLLLQAKENVLTTLQIGDLINRYAIAETLTSHELVLTNVNYEQRRKIAAIAAKNMLLKESSPHLYGHHGVEVSAYLLGSTLKSANVKAVTSPELGLFLRTGSSRDVTVLIEELMNSYVKF